MSFVRQFTRNMSSKVTPVISKNAPPAAASYSHAIKANGFIYVSGQIPYTPDGKPVTGDIKAKADQALKNALAIVEDSNSKLENIVKVNIFLKDMSNFAPFNEVYSKYFNAHKPARSCVAVADLPLGVDLEVELVAVEN
ncbi:Protein mmf1, mitochondrial [Pichia californica]|uniref:Protein mmf1, mitochondrial n=1 Tax=Pichia californica TaxID=460514 RepID=A0A9P6WNS5_9ASCO|nr:Protein mmf1, mitochondrial [[Candida] californica]KAG0690492.1 Protein mmf1, mitochondrial [[Candida] californica]